MGELDLPRLGLGKLAQVGTSSHGGKEKGIGRERVVQRKEREREGVSGREKQGERDGHGGGKLAVYLNLVLSGEQPTKAAPAYAPTTIISSRDPFPLLPTAPLSSPASARPRTKDPRAVGQGTLEN
jgi:hypothetical protein